MSTRIIGIDLAVTAVHKAIVLDADENDFITPVLSFRAIPVELDKLLKRASAGASENVKLVAIMEATHMSWYPVGVYLQRHGVIVYRVNGQKTKDLRQVYHKHAASDRIDCRVLAHLYQTLGKRLVRWFPETGDQLALQRACRELDRWRQLSTAHQNRLTSIDQWAWGGLQNLIPAKARFWMRQQWYNPWLVVAAGQSKLQSAWFDIDPRANDDWIEQWLLRAKRQTRLFGSPDMAGFDQLQDTVSRLSSENAFFKQQRQRISQDCLQPLFKKLYPNDPLVSLPGVGSESAAIYHAFIHDIHRFPSISQFRRWTGLVPGAHQSGFLEASGVSITQAGPSLVKSTLFLNSNVGRQWDVQLAALYFRQMVDYGKHHTQALCVVATHLANRIYVLLKEQRPYELRDLHDNPISKQKSRLLCLSRYKVPDEVRNRKSVRHRRHKREANIEKRYQRRQHR
jgi:transposase